MIITRKNSEDVVVIVNHVCNKHTKNSFKFVERIVQEL